MANGLKKQYRPHNTRWSRQRLSALVESRLFGFVGTLVQSGGSANLALRLSSTLGGLVQGKQRLLGEVYESNPCVH
jgi:hypothetical protein